MKAKCNYGGLVGVVPIGGSRLQETVAICGGESLLQRADELYQTGNEQDARAAVREALQVAMRRLDAKHGAGRVDRDGDVVLNEVLWEGRGVPT